MRYIDTGSRDPAHALGSWLDRHVLRDNAVVAVRWQTGFFGADSLGYFAPSMARLRAPDGVVHVLVGSNDGRTQRSDVETLLAVAGPSRPNRKIGVVSFDSGYFHPKTVHIVRADGSAAAYVGSANLTGHGVSSFHVEAAIVLDTRDGDDPAVLTHVATAIDWWFGGPREGMTVVGGPADLAALVASGILDVPSPPPAPRPRAPAPPGAPRGPRLAPLVPIPALPPGVMVLVRRPAAQAPPMIPAPQPPPQTPPMAPAPHPPSAGIAPARWKKLLSASDAQRKGTGNQRGSITLVQAGHPINAQTYFRRDLFNAANWVTDVTSTGETRETALVPFEVNFLGTNLGVLHVPVTYASNREAAQANYTSLLHLGPLARQFAARDLTGKWIVLDRRANGTFALSILDQAP